MNRRSKMALVAVAGLLALVMGLGPVGRPQAQGAAGDLAQQGEGATTTGGLVEEEGVAAASVSLRIPGLALKPQVSAVEWHPGSNPGCIHLFSGLETWDWNAPVYLPQGATVTALRMYYYDTSADYSVGSFTVYNLWGQVMWEWSVESTGISGNLWVEVAIPNHIINYDAYSYAVTWQPRVTGESMQLCGFRILYTVPGGAKYLPAVMQDYP
jgi:hypothetical protein